MWFQGKCSVLIVNLPKLRYHVRFKSSLSVIFYGSDVFSLASLQKLYNLLTVPADFKTVKGSSNECLIDRLEIVTKNDLNRVAQFAKAKGLTVHQWPHRLKPDCYDLGVVVSFGQLIDEESIKSCKYGMINVHPSLLPKYRGSTPIQKAVYAGDKETGLSVVTIQPKKYDIGKILLQQRIEIAEGSKAIDLYNSLAEIGATLLIQCISNLPFYLSNAKDQQKEGISYAVKLKKSDGQIDWRVMTSDLVDRTFRAYDGFIPIYCNWINGSPLFLMDMIDTRLTHKLNWDNLEKIVFGHVCHDKPGLVMYNSRLNGVCFKCKDNKWVVFRKLALKNYAKMTALDFKNGFISKQKQPLILPSVIKH
ncbi:methionyl-tRNA formyltransferase, mitochondrial [Tetranychus urticae]|uniref:methionyl-tRNA formyltransferase, mitochondrial n=1 Tax=Tetranychus urticae TaxID=32264 RepID=UPI00077C086A|nr:methionyl-tRNA formyltransferase, mitochondrial [Tetranychus urticae]